MAFCSQCGANNADGAKFCGGCGAALPQQGAPTSQPTWQPAPGAQTAQQGAPTAQPPWADPSWQQAAPTGQPTWQSAPSAQPSGQPTAQQQWAGQGRPGMTQVKEPRGWIGVIGAVVALIGMFLLPVISMPDYGLKITLFDMVFGDYSSLVDTGTGVFCIAAIASIIVGAVLYLMSKNQIGRILSIIGTVAYFLGTFGTNPGDWGNDLDILGMGFYLTLIGCIVMILSMTLKNANASIDAAFGGGKR